MGVLAEERIDVLRQSLIDKPLVGAVEVKFAGDSEDIEETREFLMSAFALSLVLMLIVLMVQFNSGWQAFVTMSAIVLSTGGFAWSMDYRSSFWCCYVGLGVIALAGIVVNNNIVLIDTYNEYRHRGYRAAEAAFRAGLVRFRPVVLTAVTTILGLLPMVFEMTILLVDRQVVVGAPSAQWWTQLSSTIAGGLTFATVLTLLATPAMLVIGARGDRPRSNRFGMIVRKFFRQPIAS